MRRFVSEDYLNLVRARPCLSCGKHGVHPHHIIRRRWREVARNDFTCIPLCPECHTKVHSVGIDRLGLGVKAVVEAIADQVAEFVGKDDAPF